MFAPVLAIAGGGALGALARYATVTLCQTLFGGRFPLGTLLVNALGSLMIGFFMNFYIDRLSDVEFLRLFIVVGFLGAYTTFSSFTWDTYALYMDGQWVKAVVYVLLSNALAIITLMFGMELGRLGG